jgi:DNA invertase Pin-like site-specific DNA recombinase
LIKKRSRKIKAKCALYARYSSENQREASIEDQIRKCREFAISQNWIVLDDHIYYDKAISGSSIAPRNSFKRLMDIAKSSHVPFDYILVDDTSRVARNTREALEIFEELSYNGIGVFFVSQNIDTKKETAQELITLHGMVDSLYIRELAKKTHRGIEGQVLKGYSGGGRHYGYTSEPVFSGRKDRYGNPEPDGYILKIKHDEALVVQEIFVLFAEKGCSAKRIANLLNRRLAEIGAPKPPKGKNWSMSTILGSEKNHTGILNNELYIGKYIWNKRSSKRNPETGGKKAVLNHENKWKIIEIPSLQIVSHELWNKVKKRQKEIKRKTGGRYTKAKSLYSKNLLTPYSSCAQCGGTFGITSGGRNGKYGCSTNWNKGEAACSNSFRLRKTEVEDIIVSFLSIELVEETSLAALYAEILENLSCYFTDLHRGATQIEIERALQDVRAEIENISNAIRAGIITDTTKGLLEDAERKEKELSNQLALTSAAPDLDISLLFSLDDLRRYFNMITQELIDPASTKNAFGKVVKNISFHPEGRECMLISISEDNESFTNFLFKVIEKRDSRIRLQTGTGFIPYTTRVFKIRLAFSQSPDTIDDIKTYIISGGRK